MTKRILLTGGSGFLGKHLTGVLLDAGYELRCIIRSNKAKIDSRANLIIGNLEKGIPPEAIKGIDIVIHAASEVRSPNSKLNYASNVTSTDNIIRTCKENGIKKLIYISTINTSLMHKTAYSTTKCIAETLVRNSGLDFVIIRPSMIYGAGDHNLSKTIRLVRKLPIIPVIGNGKKLMQPVYVGDVVAAILACIRKQNIKYKTYTLVGPEKITFNEYIDTILAALGKKKPKIHLPLSVIIPIAWLMEKINKYPMITLEQIYSINQDQNFDIRNERKEIGYNPARLKSKIKEML